MERRVSKPEHVWDLWDYIFCLSPRCSELLIALLSSILSLIACDNFYLFSAGENAKTAETMNLIWIEMLPWFMWGTALKFEREKLLTAEDEVMILKVKMMLLSVFFLF